MSELDKKNKEKSSFPAYEAIIGLASLYLLYQGYSQLSVAKYFTGGFFLVVGVILLIAAYVNYKNGNKKE